MDRVIELARRVVDGVTSSYSPIPWGRSPATFTSVEAIRQALGTVPLRLHLHDTHHTGIANARAGSMPSSTSSMRRSAESAVARSRQP